MSKIGDAMASSRPLIPEAPTLPRCQYCEADPAPIMTAFINQMGARLAVFHCGNCRSVFSVQMVGMLEQRQPESLIARI